MRVEGAGRMGRRRSRKTILIHSLFTAFQHSVFRIIGIIEIAVAILNKEVNKKPIAWPLRLRLFIPSN